MANSILEHFADLPDPRRARGKLHRLSDLLTIAICAVVCRADGWVAVEHFARAKEKWFGTFLDLGNGKPRAEGADEDRHVPADRDVIVDQWRAPAAVTPAAAGELPAA